MQVSMTSALYLVGSIQSAYLLLTTPAHRGRSLLRLFFGAMALLTADYFIWENNWLSPTTQFWANRFTHASLFYVLGPSLYVYIRLQASDSFWLRRRHLWHGLPYVLGLIAAIFIIPHYLPGYRASTANWLFPAATWPQLLRGTHVLIYAGLGGRFLWPQLWQPNGLSLTNNLVFLIVVLASGSIVVGTGTYLLADGQPVKSDWQQVSVLCAVGMIYLINHLLTEHRFNRLRLSPTLAGGIHPAGNPVQVPHKYQHSTLDPVSAARLFEQLEAHLSTKRAYEDADLTLPQLAQTLSVSVNHLSQVINQGGNQSFYELMNRHRVDAACKLLVDCRQQHLSVLGIGYEVGFRSKSTYYAAFRRERGLTPNAYRQQMSASNPD